MRGLKGRCEASVSNAQLRAMTVDQYTESWEVWDRAWDAARESDDATGRRYEKSRYQEAASAARRAYAETVTGIRAAVTP